MGIHHAFGQRNAPTILNALFNTLQFWGGRAPTLETLKFQAVFNGPVAMGDIGRAIVRKLHSIHPSTVSWRATRARSRTAPSAIEDGAKRGWALFNGKGRCMTCHGWNPTQPLFTTYRRFRRSELTPSSIAPLLAAGG
jgi:cytochrome c peroxidase